MNEDVSGRFDHGSWLSYAIQKREVGEDSEIFAVERIYHSFFSKGTSPHNQELFLRFVREQMIEAPKGKYKY